MPTEIRRADQRFHTSIGWLESWHSFSFGDHYDPAETGFGLLLVNNDDVVAPASGFGTHGHADMEIVTWVLDGRLAHRDSEGNAGELMPGLAQRMSAGTGIRHSEMNPSPDTPAHFVQMWVVPDTVGIAPGYEQRDVSAQLHSGRLVAVASGDPSVDAIHINQRDATLWASRLDPHDSVVVPSAPFVHVFAARGAVSVSGVGDEPFDLEQGGAARVTGASDLTVVAGEAPAEVLVWNMRSEMARSRM